MVSCSANRLSNSSCTSLQQGLHCYVAGEDNPHAFINKKVDNFQKFLQLSKRNIQTLIGGTDKFYEYDDFEKEL